MVISSFNIGVGLRLARQKKFRFVHAHNGKKELHQETQPAKDNQAVQMLVASVMVYVITQFPLFVFNILEAARLWPFCSAKLSEESMAIYIKINGILIAFNYSTNFLWYFAVSPAFREELRQLMWGRTRSNPPTIRVNLSQKKSLSSIQTNSTTVP